MKHKLGKSLGLAALVASLHLTFAAEGASGGLIDFGKFTPPAKGGEYVEVKIGPNLIGLVARLAEKQEPEAAKLLRGLQSVRVNVIGLDDANRAEVSGRLEAVRQQLDGGGWERIVTAQQKDQEVGVYLKLRGEESVEGLVVTVIEGNKQAVLVNIVGDIRPEQVAALGERLDIEPLKKAGESLKKQ